MTTSTTQDQVKTHHTLILRAATRRRGYYTVAVKKDRGGLWRITSFEDRINRSEWMADVLEYGRAAGLLEGEEITIYEKNGIHADLLRGNMRIRRPEDIKLEKTYARLMALVRVIFMDKRGERISSPVVDGYASILFDKGGIATSRHDKGTIFTRLRIETED